MDQACVNVDTTNPDLVAACQCQKATVELANAVNVYKTTTEHNLDLTNVYNTTTLPNYMTVHSTWQQASDANLAAIRGQRQAGNNCTPAAYCPSSTCNSGWRSDGSVSGSQGNCSICAGKLCANTGCQLQCEPDDNTVNAQHNNWLNKNPEPQKPPPPAQVPIKPPNGNNIQCCSQVFSGITANSVNFSNLQQTCTQDISNQIGNAIQAGVIKNIQNQQMVQDNIIASQEALIASHNAAILQQEEKEFAIIFGIVLCIIFISLSVINTIFSD